MAQPGPGPGRQFPYHSTVPSFILERSKVDVAETAVPSVYQAREHSELDDYALLTVRWPAERRRTDPAMPPENAIEPAPLCCAG